MNEELEIKARFFAQYWGQKYILDNGTLYWTVNHRAFPVDETACLELKALSEITDEDAMTAIRIVKVYVRKDGAYVTEHVPIENIKKSFLDVPVWRLDLADFLRSKGYALPFMEYSIEDLINKGWIRLCK